MCASLPPGQWDLPGSQVLQGQAQGLSGEGTVGGQLSSQWADGRARVPGKELALHPLATVGGFEARGWWDPFVNTPSRQRAGGYECTGERDAF